MDLGEPAGLYIHVPFCSAICPYCDFAVRTGKPKVRTDFVETLTQEIALWGIWSEPFDSLYLGGGTPSLLEPEQLCRIIDAVREHLPMAEDTRIFLEANPEDVDAERARAWHELGITTLSLGVQSFVASELRWLGRRHDANRAHDSVAICMESGFTTVSVDLIFGLPDQSIQALKHSLDAVSDCKPQHVSCYQLTIHENTPFARRREQGKLIEMDDNTQADLLELVHTELGNAGWLAYEVSNFAVSSEHRSRHNQKYWHHVPYLGLGPSAHSFDGRKRWWNLRELPMYEEQIRKGQQPIEQSESLSDKELALETLMLGLRTTAGVDLNRFRERYRIDLMAHNKSLIAELEVGGFIRNQGTSLVPTVAGLAVADGMAGKFSLVQRETQ